MANSVHDFAFLANLSLLPSTRLLNTRSNNNRVKSRPSLFHRDPFEKSRFEKKEEEVKLAILRESGLLFFGRVC